jgi:hypothetical protein
MSENEHPLLQERTCLIQILGMIILNRQDSFCWYDYCAMLYNLDYSRVEVAVAVRKWLMKL